MELKFASEKQWTLKQLKKKFRDKAITIERINGGWLVYQDGETPPIAKQYDELSKSKHPWRD